MDVIQYNQKYYNEIICNRKCGSNKFEQINFNLGGMAKEELKQQWLCHVKADKFANNFYQGKRVIATTGFGLTGVPHVGNIGQIIKAIKLQKSGIPVQIVLGDLDAYCGKAKNWHSIKNLVSKYKQFIKNLGFKNEYPSIVRTQSEALNVLKTLYLTGYYINDKMFDLAKEDIHDYYSQQGKIDKDMTYRIKLSLNLMVADFIDPHISAGYDNVIVFLGIDEYKYVGLAMNVLMGLQANSCYSDFSLSALFSFTMKGLNNFPKMGKSLPGSGLTPLMNHNEIRKVIMLSGNQETIPEDNIVFQMISSASFYSMEKIKYAKFAYQNNVLQWEIIKKEYLSDLLTIFGKWEK